MNRNKINLDYWNKLDDFINKKINVSWIYFFYPSSFLKSINYARNYIDHINHLSKNTYKHQLIENYFTKT